MLYVVLLSRKKEFPKKITQGHEKMYIIPGLFHRREIRITIADKKACLRVKPGAGANMVTIKVASH